MLIKNATIFDGQKLIPNKCVEIKEQKIERIFSSIDEQDQTPSTLQVLDAKGHLLVPGFIDLQINGGGGCFFNQNPSLEGLKTIAQAHLEQGTTSFLATLISDRFDVIQKGCLAVQEAQGKIEGVLGIHLEGPYLNPEKKGIHNLAYIRSPSPKEIDFICQLNLPCKLLTLAPEMVSQELLSQFIETGVVVFAGHTKASFQELSRAHAQGVRGLTHFFNACSPFSSREPGVVGAGLWFDSLWCCLIADGLHVSFDSLKIAFKAKSTEHFILVSDAMSPVGLPQQEEKKESAQFELQGKPIFICHEANFPTPRYRDAQGVLAGSSLTMHQALQNIVNNQCAPLEQALAMSSYNPAQCLGLQHQKGRVREGYDAELLLLEKKSLRILNVIQGGKEIPLGL